MSKRGPNDITGNTDSANAAWKRNASDIIKEAMMKKEGGGKYQVGKSSYAEKRENKNSHQDMVKQRIESYKKEMVNEASNRKSVNLPGTDPNEQYALSESAKEIIEQMAARKAKKDERKEKMKEQFKPKEDGKKKGLLNWMGAAVGATGGDNDMQAKKQRDDDERRRREEDRRIRREERLLREEEDRRRRREEDGGWW